MLIQIPGPADCNLIGFCGAAADQVGPPPGIMYLAVGLVMAGVWGLWRERRPLPPAEAELPRTE